MNIISNTVGYFFWAVSCFWVCVPTVEAQNLALDAAAASQCGKSDDEREGAAFNRKDYSEQEAAAFRQKAEKGDASAMLEYARWEKLSNPERIAWLRRAAEANLPHAQYSLATYPQSGLGRDEIFHWLQLAAVQGHNEAQSTLGIRYATLKPSYGKGAEVAAEYWTVKAAENGNGYSLSFLCRRAYRMAPVRGDQDYKQAVYWCEKALALGCNTARKMMAEMYENGHGVTKDLAKAGEIFSKYLNNPQIKE